MKRTLFFMALLFTVLLCRTPTAEATMTYGLSFYEDNVAYRGSKGYNDPLWQFINEVETTIDGTSGVTNIIFTPGTAPAATEGSVYYDAGVNNLKLRTDSAWVDIDVSGASSLGTAYTAGSKILAPTLEVEIEVADSSNNPALRLDFDDATTNAQDVLVIDNAGDDGAAVSIQINGQAGFDIQGTSDTWNVTIAGVATLPGIILGGTDMVMEQGDTFNNTDDDVFEFTTDDKEDFEIDLSGTNIVKFTSDTSAITLEFDSLDRFTGVEDITFDAEAGNITLTADAGTEDLTISQSGAVDASLILQSAGTGTDALSLISSAADISLVSADNITRTAADNITDVLTDGGYTLTIGGSTNGKYISTVADTYSMIAVDTVTIQNTEASKDITINSVLGSILIEGEEDAASAVLITADGGTTTSLKIHNDTGTSVTEGAGSIEILSDVGGVEIHSSANLAKAIQIVADGGVTESIYVQADQGTAASAATESDAALQLVADVGGVGIRSGLNAVNSIRLESDGGTSEGIIIHSNQGTSVTEGTNAVQLLADAGGIGLESNANLAKAVSIVSDGGTTSSIYIQADTGTAAAATTETDASIQLLSDLGGIALVSGLAAVDAIRLEATAAAAQITVQNKLGTTAAAATESDASIQLYSEVGGIGLRSSLDAADAIRLEADAGTSETINIHSNQGTGAASINLLSDVGGITLNAGSGGVVFTAGQTKSVIFMPTDVELDSAKPPGTTSIGTSEQAEFDTLGFDANPDVTGDDGVFVNWVVPAGYIADSADLHCYWTFSTAEDAADECTIDGTVNATAAGEAVDTAGTAMAAVASVIADASADNGKLVKTSLDIEVEDIAVGDLVTIWFWFDESACLMANSGTADVHYFEITYESTE